MIAHVTGLKPFEFVHFLGDAHIYHNHFAQVQEQLKREPLPLPRLWLNPRVSCLADFQMDDIKLIDYKHHPAIKAPLNV
jgi:thymidylate synthase